MKTIYSLQIVRALAAWSVVFHHYVQLYFNMKTNHSLGAFFANYGGLGVDVFFVLSGFIISLLAKGDHSPTSFLLSRFLRIAPAYYFFSAIIVVLIATAPLGFNYTDYSSITLLANALFLPIANPSGLGDYPVLTVGWTLQFEIFFYCVFAICLFLSKKHSLLIVATILFILPLIYSSNIYYSNIASDKRLWEFSAGVVIAKCWGSISVRSVLARFPLAAALFASSAMAITAMTIDKIPYSQLLFATSVVCAALAVEPLLNRDSKLVRWMVGLGNKSYSTYLIHVIVLGVAIQIGGKQLSMIEQTTALVVSTISIYVLSGWSYRFIERAKWIENLSRRCTHSEPPLPDSPTSKLTVLSP